MKNLLVIFLCLGVSVLSAQPRIDTTFRVDVMRPMFVESQPKVLIDEAHNNLHRKETGLFALTRMMESDGAMVESNHKKFTAEILDGYDILIIANALHVSNVGNWQNPCPSAFSKKEIDVIVDFVNGGGALLLVADHMPYGGAAQDLAKKFGVDWNNGFAIRQGQHWPPSVFDRKDNMVLDSPVTTDSDYSKEISYIASFAGSVFKVPENAQPFMVYDDSHIILMPDIAWQFSEETKNENSNGWVQGACMEYGKGRIVFLGEAAMITAQLGDSDHKVGMNNKEDAPENTQLALNIFRYLAALNN
ncbi:MAG: hypothetical protein RLN88_15065 [Ekhidna sp.]|uniref:hypothetical protein n=1 Tax=Ekhidna sp. TaxID=2608089 RepID=UPI0032EBC14D